jgi:hypothetical protein
MTELQTQMIELDAANWKVPDDFYVALLVALGSPTWHGHNVNALIDSMIWGGINAIDPPYKIIVHNIRLAPSSVAYEVGFAKEALARGRADFQARKGYDIDVDLETVA